MDRMLLESYPYRIIEGIAIAAYAVGADRGYLYIRAEYPLAVQRVQEALQKCEEHGGTDLAYPDIIVHERNTKHNLLVIELKMNEPRCQCDIRKLELFTNKNGEYGYTLGLFIQFDDSRPELKWFKDGKQTD